MSDSPARSPQFALNASRIGLQGGLKTFTLEMMKALSAEDYSYEAVVPAGFVPPPGVRTIPTPASLAGASNLSLLRPIKWLAYSRFRFPIAKSQRVLCTTHQVLPGRRNQIVTVHDLRPYFFPDTPVQSFYFRHMLPRALRHCDGILTVSEMSRQLIATIYGLPLEQIAVVSNVIQPPSPERVQSSPDTVDPFLLAVGASWPHKNVESLLKQHSLWSSRYRLNIVAGIGQYRTSLERLAQTLGIAERIRFCENISQEQLHQLYTDCSALVAPSRMEGFGLPPLEAMARRRSVIVSDIPVFRELYGHHAIFVDTEDSSSWEKAFAALQSVSTSAIDAAQKHALTYNRTRMAVSLKNALDKFWGKTV